MQLTGYILLLSAALIALFGQAPVLAKIGSNGTEVGAAAKPTPPRN